MAKILYVEDNEMNRDMLGRRLTRREFEVVFAFDGQEGLDKMKSENPDIRIPGNPDFRKSYF